MLSRLPQRSVPTLVAAAGCWLVTVALLLALPVLVPAGDAVRLLATGSPVWLGCLVVITLQAIALTWSASLPRASLLITAALPLPLASVGAGDTFSLTATVVVAAVFATVLACPLRRLGPALVGAVALVAVGGATNALVGGAPSAAAAIGTAVANAVGVVGLPLLLGSAVAGRRDARVALRKEAAANRRERDALVRAAVADERTAMARELHDIAAHHLSGMALLAAAVDRQIDTEPAVAKQSVRQIRAQSTAVLADLRRLLGLLRAEDEATLAGPSVPSVAGIAALVDERRAAGASIELLLRPGAGPLGYGLGPIAQLAAYRIVQESLTNATRHAPGRRVVLEVDDTAADALVVRASNPLEAPGPGSGAGFGLIGMRERAELLGGTLEFGPTADGRWRVCATIPRDAEQS